MHILHILYIVTHILYYNICSWKMVYHRIQQQNLQLKAPLVLCVPMLYELVIRLEPKIQCILAWYTYFLYIICCAVYLCSYADICIQMKIHSLIVVYTVLNIGYIENFVEFCGDIIYIYLYIYEIRVYYMYIMYICTSDNILPVK